MFIQTESTPNESSLKFLPNTPVMGPTGGVHEFLSPQSALKSPLADTLFRIPGVKSILYGSDFIAVNKDEDASWGSIKPEIFSNMMEFFSAEDAQSRLFTEGDGLFDGPEDTRPKEGDSETVLMIKELLDTRIRPAIQEDGGDIEYRVFEEETGIVKVSLKGSCRGCDSSTVTLKSGIERMLMHYVPDVKGVEQIPGPEEVVAKDEFSKFEARLRSGGKSVHI